MIFALAAVVLMQDTTGAADIVARARSARSRNERLVTAYTATVNQRIGVGIRALSRDRMLFGQELAANSSWHRDGPSRIDVTGARQRIPVAFRGNQVPDDLDATVKWMVIDPAADYLRIAGQDAEGFQHPMREGSEADYEFFAGDTSIIRLPSGRTVRLLELQVRPRRSDFRLMNGSLWFDADTYGMVRAVFAPARPFDLELDGDSGDADDVPGLLKPIRGTLRYVTIEYGLYEQRWWMMRYVALDLEAQAAAIRVPIRFERTYDNYRVQGGAEPVAGARRPAGSVRPQERDTTPVDADSLARAIEECIREMVDSAVTRSQNRGREARAEITIGSPRFERRCRRRMRENETWPIEVGIPDDTASLLSSPELGEPILDIGDVITEDEIRQFGRELGILRQQSPLSYRPDLPRGLGDLLRRARYNRIEALSLALAFTTPAGNSVIDGLARIGVADLEPSFELGLTRRLGRANFRLGGYRRLAVANPETRALGIGNSISALLLQRDDGEYFRTLGAELTLANATSGWWNARLYFERQDEATVETNASLPRLFSKSNSFRANIHALEAEQVGAELTIRGNRTLSNTLLAGADFTIDGGTGNRSYGRASLTVRAALTPAGPLAFAVEGAAGASAGDPLMPQHLFFLGGPATLRGFPGATRASDQFWRARAEVANNFPAFRVVAFGDVGDAGGRIYSVGMGFSVLDGLIRLDLARGLEPYRNWRFDAYLDGLF